MEFKKHIHYSDELEAAVLGVCLLEKDAFGRTFGIMDKDCLYSDANKVVYDVLAEMYHAGIPIDLLTVTDYLFNRKKISDINGDNIPYYLSKLSRNVVSSANIEYHSFILKKMWMEREVLKLTNGGIKLEGDVKEQIYQLTKAIQEINQGVYTKDWQDMSELIYGLMKHQEEIALNNGQGITTGIPILDRENGGFFPGQLIVIGARPSVGKSAFMGQMAIAMAKKGVKVGIISLEMNNNEIAARLSSLESNMDFKMIFRNLYRDEDQKTIWYDKMRDIVNLPIFVSDKTKVTAVDIKAKASKLKNAEGLGCIFVDYLQLVNSEESFKNRTRENEVSQISRMGKLIAKDLNVPVIFLCQLNRQVTQRKGNDRYPVLSDLRESGSIEQDADVVMFLHRDYMAGIEVDENGVSTESKADLIVRKWRNGKPNLHIPLHFDAPKMKFQFHNLNSIKEIAPEKEDNNESEINPF